MSKSAKMKPFIGKTLILIALFASCKKQVVQPNNGQSTNNPIAQRNMKMQAIGDINLYAFWQKDSIYHPASFHSLWTSFNWSYTFQSEIGDTIHFGANSNAGGSTASYTTIRLYNEGIIVDSDISVIAPDIYYIVK